MKKFLVGMVALIVAIGALWWICFKSGTGESSSKPETPSAEKQGITLTQQEYEEFQQLITQLKSGELGSQSEPSKEEGNQPEKSEGGEEQSKEQDPIQAQVPSEPPKGVVIEKNMKRHYPHIYSTTYEVMAGDCNWLDKEGTFTIMLFGKIEKVSATDKSTNYTTYKEVAITESNDTSETYYTFDYECLQDNKIVFCVQMQGGEEYFFAVQKI